MGKLNQHHFPECGDYDTWVDMVPEQEEERHFELSPLRIAGLAEFASLILFCGMIAIWLMIGDVNFPEVPQ